MDIFVHSVFILFLSFHIVSFCFGTAVSSPVDTRRRFSVYKTTIWRQRRRIKFYFIICPFSATFLLCSLFFIYLFLFLGGASTSVCHFFPPSVCPSVRPSFCCAPYLRNRTSSDHNFWCTYVKYDISRCFSIFSKL